MRIWDVPCSEIKDQNLLGEHRELHAIWNVITEGKKGYSQHPETKRWIGKLQALFKRHEEQVKEMEKRGFKHQSPLEEEKAAGKQRQDELVTPIKEQYELLEEKDALKQKD